MPSLLHEAIVQLLRERPELVLHVLGTAGAQAFGAYDTVCTDSGDLGTAVPSELKADCVVRLESRGRTTLTIVIEVQLSTDPHKRFTWPAYITGARSRHRCGAILAVVTPYESVAAWARAPIELGPGSGHLQPWVLGPSEMPAVRDEAQALELPEFAVLSAITHAQDKDVANAARLASLAFKAAFSLPDARAQVYYDLIWVALSESAREALKMIPQNYEYQHEGLRRAKIEGKVEGEAKGKAEGEAKGKAEGEAKGKAEGEVSALRQALLGVLQARGFDVDQDARTRILGCMIASQLNQWLLAAVQAASVNEALGC